ncbi:hypothetical protein FA13DRAFT_1725786 [Coprinellus micaceus]|uniref:Uncharacterized protein n=1 Tax=Coprinellus micaceus TaxID=71717 RepID=A0A4Y7TW89_COPMI|nr:hypothetical protein FA13DRAFT_1725786 [Coprinellus micaceus]
MSAVGCPRLSLSEPQRHLPSSFAQGDISCSNDDGQKKRRRGTATSAETKGEPACRPFRCVCTKRKQRSSSSSTSSSWSSHEDSTPPERGRPFRRKAASIANDEEVMEPCMYLVVRREKLNQAVGRIVFLPSPQVRFNSSRVLSIG